jgi:ketose-bisphosphate aldolase
MPLVNMNEMLRKAGRGGYAVGAFNILDYNSTRAVVEAAEQLCAPVIIQTSTKTVEFWGAQAIASWVRQLCEQTTSEIALHLDHCKDMDMIQKCIDAGWSSVMIDASSRPFAENVALSKQVVAMARPRGISVEAELGAIVGVEDDIHVKEQDAHLADPAQALEFCREVKPDCFAPAIGTAHGIYKGEPKIAYELLERVWRETGLPLALHGGTGLSEAVFKKCISLGCVKVNISTQLKYAFIDSFADFHRDHPQDYNPLHLIKAQYDAMKKDIQHNIRLFGKEGLNFKERK